MNEKDSHQKLIIDASRRSPLRLMDPHPFHLVLRSIATMALIGFVLLSGDCCAQDFSKPKPNPGASRQTKAVPTSGIPGNKTADAAKSSAPEPQLIWSQTDPASKIGNDCYFRRVLDIPEVEQAFLDFGSAGACEVYFNGRRIRTSKPNTDRERADLMSGVRPGKNILAVRVLDRDKLVPGFKAAFYFKPQKGNWRVVITDGEWKASKLVQPNWQLLRYNDDAWKSAVTVSSLKEAEAALAASPKTQEIEDEDDYEYEPKTVAAPRSTEAAMVSLRGPANGPANDKLSKRFTTQPGFVVEQILDNKLGSLIGIAFNEFGHIIASREGGGLLLLYDSDRDGIPDKSRDYGDMVTNVQGILPLNGDVYVTGDGSDGPGLYRLLDQDRNGILEKSELLLKFKGVPGEHGAHQLAFGPDGCIYLTIGNHAQLATPIDPASSYRVTYEGDLVQPRFEDPGGHATGVKAPGGTVVRLDLASRTIDVVAGGLRNAYDLAFHPNGSLYLHDSDMEADIGAVWHRPTGLFRIVEGGEYGWRSGWANWPEYYLDRLPSLANTGRGSPTGITVYNHFAFPSRYHRSLFSADWSEGRIIAINLDATDKGRVRAEDFVVGAPMNVTDLEVGPEGALYFCTGGRGTDGGIYRVRWDGEIPENVSNLGSGITRAVRQPQLYSAWARQSVAVLKKEIGAEWNEKIIGVAMSSDNPAKYRMQAIDLMQLLGPVPTTEMLVELTNTSNELVRAKAARLLGLHVEEASGVRRLRELLKDTSANVRIAACEALVRLDVECTSDELVPLIESDNREERFVARKLLTKIPTRDWQDALLSSKTPRLVINASLALITSAPTRENAEAVASSLLKLSKGFVSDADFLDLLRVMQVTLHLSGLNADDVPSVKQFVEQEFPAGNSTINGELARLATYLQCDLVHQAIDYLQLDVAMPDRMLVAMHLPMMPHQWTTSERMATLQFLENCLKVKSGGSYPLYVMKTSESLSEFLTENEALQILELGERYPNAALSALFKVPEELTGDQIQTLIRLDTAIDKSGLEEDVYKRLKTGITAVLSQQKDESAVEHLRQRWRKSPDRRATIALALAQRPDDKNWDYLVRSMSVLDPFAVPDVCNALRQMDVATDDSEAIRQTILQGCKLIEAKEDPKPTIQLLEYWTGEKFAADGQSSPMVAWQQWFARRFPDSVPATLPTELEQPRWSPAFLDQFLNGDQGKYGSMEVGAAIYAKARCNACHKVNAEGGGFGPDLSSLSRRFTRAEVIESILFPSHVISDQYATKKVLTKTGEVHTGIVVQTSKGIAVRVNENKEYVLDEEDVEEILPSKMSAMPSGLLDSLSPTEIRDLLCYLGVVPQDKVAQEKPATIRR